jgi:hypothetical protein
MEEKKHTKTRIHTKRAVSTWKDRTYTYERNPPVFKRNFIGMFLRDYLANNPNMRPCDIYNQMGISKTAYDNFAAIDSVVSPLKWERFRVATKTSKEKFWAMVREFYENYKDEKVSK